MLVNDKNNRIYNLFFVLRSLSIMLLFEVIYVMVYFISDLLDYRNIERVSNWYLDGNKILSFYTKFIIVSLIVYMIFMTINYLLLKSKFKHVKLVLIIEIIIVVITIIAIYVKI